MVSSVTELASIDHDLINVITGLMDSPELGAGTVVWLTKGQRTWLNGRFISANWDMNELEERKDEIVAGDKLKMRMVL